MFVLSIHSSTLTLPHHFRLLIKFVISSRFYTFLINFFILRGFLLLIKSKKAFDSRRKPTPVFFLLLFFSFVGTVSDSAAKRQMEMQRI